MACWGMLPHVGTYFKTPICIPKKQLLRHLQLHLLGYTYKTGRERGGGGRERGGGGERERERDATCCAYPIVHNSAHHVQHFPLLCSTSIIKGELVRHGQVAKQLKSYTPMLGITGRRRWPQAVEMPM